MTSLEDLDDVTPRYLRLMDGFGMQSRRVLAALAECEQPATARQVGEVARLSTHTASMVLLRLSGEHIVVTKINLRLHKYSFKDAMLCEWLRARSYPRQARAESESC